MEDKAGRDSRGLLEAVLVTGICECGGQPLLAKVVAKLLEVGWAEG